MELSDFDVKKLVLEDFSTAEEVGGITVSETATNPIAVNSTISSPGSTSSDLRSLGQELTTQEGRRRWLQEWNDKFEELHRAASSDVGNILIDPSLNADQKGDLLGSAATNSPQLDINLSDTVSYQAAMEDGDPNESESAFLSRTDMIGMISDVNNYKYSMQSYIDEIAAGNGSSLKTLVADFGELLVPFAEHLYYGRLAKETGLDQDFWLGEQKANVLNAAKSMTFQERQKLTETLMSMVEQDSSILFRDGNDLVALDALEQISGLNDYSNFEKWFDNVVTVMDWFGVGGLVKGTAKGGARAASRLSAARRLKVRGAKRPLSPASLVEEANPAAARTIDRVIEADPTDQAARDLAGVPRNEALAESYLPDPEIDPSTVRFKHTTEGPQFEEAEALKASRTMSGTDQFTDAERSTAISTVRENLKRTDGMEYHPESMTIRSNEDGTITFKAMYHPGDAGWRVADQAVSNALFSFRKYGLSEDDIVLYARTPQGWTKTTQEELTARKVAREAFTKAKKKIPSDLKEIDYAVGIDYKWQMTADDLDLGAYENLSVGGGLLKWTSGWGEKAGSLLEHLLPADSVYHKQLTLSANAAVDREVGLRKQLVDMFLPFVDFYNKLPKPRRGMVSDYINEANLQGIRFDVADLMARGFSEAEVEGLKAWRRGNDALWYMSNHDLITSMRNKGYMFLRDSEGTALVVKPIKKKGLGSQKIKEIGGKLRLYDRSEIDDLYENGGVVAKLPQPTKIDGEWVENVLVRNDPTSGYLRRIRDDDILLNYRDGYYPVVNDAHFFITKKVRTPEGNKNITIASARNKEDLDNYLENVIRDNPDGVKDPENYYSYHEDTRSPRDGSYGGGESAWNLATTSGITSQRVRGQRLVDAASPESVANHQNLLDPLQAVSKQIGQVSSRIQLRPWLDAAKQRWLSQYGDKLELPKNDFGQHGFPSAKADLKPKSGVPNSLVAEAQTAYDYIRKMEQGYINQVDSVTKMLLHKGADIMADIAPKAMEEFVRDVARSTNITGTIKGAAFRLYLAAAPFRQVLVQSNQAIQLSAIDAKYMLGGIQRDLWRLRKVFRGLSDDAEAKGWLDELRRSGMLYAVDANNLTRKDQLDLATLTILAKAAKAAKKPLDLTQKIGFDVAEQSVLVTSWLTHRDLMVKKLGRTKLTRKEYETISGQARAYTYSMNRAGDMPYNRNGLSIIAQFLQVPHKAFLQPLTSRTLTWKQKSSLLLWNGLMYGVPAGIFGNLLPNHWFESETKGESSVTREVMEYGLEDVMFNYLLSTMFQEPVRIDWGDLRPGELSGARDLVTSLILQGDIGAAVAEAPAVSLFLGSNPRITNAIKEGAKYFTPGRDYNDPELDTTFMDVVHTSLLMFSGYSHAFKAKYAMKTGQKMSSYGSILDTSVNYPEALAQFFGMQTRDEKAYFLSKEVLYSDAEFTASIPKDMQKWYDEMRRHLARRHNSVTEMDIERRALAEAWSVFEDSNYEARDALMNLIMRDAKKGNLDFIDGIIKRMGLMDLGTLKEIISRLPDGPEKDYLIEDMNILYGE